MQCIVMSLVIICATTIKSSSYPCGCASTDCIKGWTYDGNDCPGSCCLYV